MSKTKEKQQGRIMPREEFKLLKFKVAKEGLTITHHVNGTTPTDITAVVNSKPHPDLKTAMDKLQLHMATRLGILAGWDFAREHLRKNPNYLQHAIQGHKEAVSMMNVNGLTFVGTGETYGVMITGSIKVPGNGSTGLSVPKITFGKTDLGYKDEVEEICKEITDEVYNYLILRKKEQTDIEDQAEGFDNNGGVQTSILDEEQKPLDMTNGFDSNGERDFVPSAEQLGEFEIENEE